MSKPNFFIIGAPKCGTSSLARWLNEHPNVFFSPRKEPHLFNTDGHTATQSLAEYEALFRDAAAEHRAIGEGSTHYLYSQVAVPNILEYNPEARFIVCLRNPIEMAPALHSERLSQGRENEPNFERAWQMQTIRAEGRNIPQTVQKDPERLQYGPYCLLGQQLERVYAHVPPEQVHYILLDDIRRSEKAEYERVLAFLGLERKTSSITFENVNSAKHTRFPRLAIATRTLASIKKRTGIKRSFGVASWLRAQNVSPGTRAELSPEMRRALIDYFAADIDKLAKLTGRDLSTWLK